MVCKSEEQEKRIKQKKNKPDFKFFDPQKRYYEFRVIKHILAILYMLINKYNTVASIHSVLKSAINEVSYTTKMKIANLFAKAMPSLRNILGIEYRA